MTNQEINERIASIAGFHDKFGLKKRGLWYRPNAFGYTNREEEAGRYTIAEAHEHAHPDGEPVTIHKFSTPNYAESLDACRAFERTLDVTESTEYAVQLRRIVTRNAESEDKHPDTMRIPDGRYYCATPLERCEAFLRIKGQWE